MRRFAIIAAVVSILCLSCAATADVPAPLAVGNEAVGGAALNSYTPGVEGGAGVNNIGLLIKTWGKVTYVDGSGSYFYIDDGTNRMDGSGQMGIRVSCENLAPGNSITAPAVDSYVMITCISSTIVINTKIQPNLRPRRQDDIQLVSL